MISLNAFNWRFLDNHNGNTNQMCVYFRWKRRYERLVVAKSAAAVVVVDAVMMLLLRDSKIRSIISFDAFNLKLVDNYNGNKNQMCVDFCWKRCYERLVVAKRVAAVVVVDAVR